MLAAETIVEALKAGGATAERLALFGRKVEGSWIKQEMYPVRNFHQAFEHGLPAGMFQAGVGLVTGGRGWGFKDRLPAHSGHEMMVNLQTPKGKGMQPRAPGAPGGPRTLGRRSAPH